MKLFQTLQKLLPLAMAAALACGGSATKSWAASKTTDGKPAPAKAFTPAKLVDINTAKTAELEEVPGIGPAYAKKIIANRPYASVKDLSKTGIPAARLEKILPLLTVKEKLTTKVKTAEKARPFAAGEKKESAGGKSFTASKTKKPSALVDLNTATAEQLESIPGIGPAYAEKIIAARPYASVKDLSKAGIPAARLEKIVPLVTATRQATATEKPTAKNRPAGGSSDKVSKTVKTEKPSATTSVDARTPPRKGMVWANSDSKIYHVEGDRWYGKTKEGEWMTEDDAIKVGYRKSKQGPGS
jgi:DNA uptake protein ComE-like DNA-binding protein